MKYKLIQEKDPGLSFIGQYLKNRGVEDVENFFQIDASCINSPYNLDYMKEAVNLLCHHIEADSKIAVLVDCDVDGFTSAALLFNYINFFREPEREWCNYAGDIVPIFHEGKTHGLDDTKVMRDLRDNIKPNLLIIPDASGSEEQYAALVSLGIDILVLDHHDMECRGDGESVVVVNNQQSQNYTNKDFSGVGVTWQFCRALDDRFMWDAADIWLDLVAMGNIGDVMNLQSPETRWVVVNGFKEPYYNSFFLHYQQFTSYSMQNKNFNPHNIAFYVVPMFNAVCRIGSMEEKELLFKSLLDCEAQTPIENGTRGHKGEMVPLVAEASRIATNAKGRQDRRKNKLAELINTVIHDEGLAQHRVIVLGFDDFEEEYRALSGVTAAALAEIYARPVIVTFRKNNSYVGSLRVPDTNNPAYENFKDQCNESGYCTFCSGHQQAAGIGIKEDCIDALTEYFDEKYKDIDTDLQYDVDFVIDANDPQVGDLIAQLTEIRDIHGQGLKEPKIAIKNVKIGPSTLQLVGAKKTTLWITNPNFKLINFKSCREEYESLKLPYDGIEQYYLATVICESPDMNEWQGVVTPQLQIVDYNLDTVKYDF